MTDIDHLPQDLDDDEPFDLDKLRNDDQEHLLDDSDEEEEDSEADDIDFENFKGIYHGDDPNRKYTCPDTGAHFEHRDFCKRLNLAKEQRQEFDSEWEVEMAKRRKQNPELAKRSL